MMDEKILIVSPRG